MKLNLRDRVAFWLENFKILDRVLLKYDGRTDGPDGRKWRYVNRINGHIVMRDTISQKMITREFSKWIDRNYEKLPRWFAGEFSGMFNLTTFTRLEIIEIAIRSRNVSLLNNLADWRFFQYTVERVSKESRLELLDELIERAESGRGFNVNHLHHRKAGARRVLELAEERYHERRQEDPNDEFNDYFFWEN